MIQNPFSEFSAGIQALIAITSVVALAIIVLIIRLITGLIRKSLNEVYSNKK